MDKQDMLFKGVGMHLITYLLICMFLFLVGVPGIVTVMLFLVFSWGLFVLSYAFMNKA